MPDRWAWSAFQAAAFATTAMWAARVFRDPAMAVPWTDRGWPLAAVLLWACVQVTAHTTVYPWETWNWILNWAAYLAVFLIAVHAFRDSATRHRFLVRTAAFTGVLGAAAMLQLYTSRGKIFWLFPSGYTETVLGPFVNRNQYAAFMELLLPIPAWLAFTDHRRWAWWAMALAVGFASVVASASRAGAAIAAAEIFVCLFLVRRRGLLPRGQSAWIAACVIALVVAWSAAAGWDALERRLRAHEPEIMRREMLRASMDMIRDYPRMGTGMGTWAAAYPHYASIDAGQYVNQAHNDWACWAAEGGIPAFAALAIFFGSLVLPAIRCLWGLGIPAVMIHAAVDYPMQQRPALGACVLAMAGAVAATARRTDRATSSCAPAEASGSTGRR